jgi:hypothetical protein
MATPTAKLLLFAAITASAGWLAYQSGAAERAEEKLPSIITNLTPKPIAKDPSVKYDFDIVYVRTPRKDGVRSWWAEVGIPYKMDPGGDLMLLHPDGKEELLVAAGPDSSVADPFVSFDGQWVYYALFRGLKNTDKFKPSALGSDIYKVHARSKKVVRLTDQTFTPNTGAADWSKGFRTPEKGKTHLSYGVINSGPCPLPGGKVVFTSNRNAFRPPVPATGGNITLQLFVMDDDGKNVECIGHLNLGAAMHPVILKDGRILFSTFEHQGRRGDLNWGLWTIHPDGTRWAPLVSAYFHNTIHFQTQLSDERIVFEEYYNGGNFGFGTFYKVAPRAPEGTPAFGPGYVHGPGPRLIHLPGVHGDHRYPFHPYGLETLTRFCSGFDAPARQADPRRKDSPRVGKVTHPSGAPDNHLLTVYSPGGVNIGKQDLDSGIYLLKSGKPINEPGELLLIKNDRSTNEQWPRALVPYERIYGVKEPKRLPALKNDGKLSRHLPEGTPFGLVGSSSLYKRESFPQGLLRPGSVTATAPQHPDVATLLLHRDNWTNQGADAGLYANSDIWGVRILALEPTTDRGGRLFYSHAKSERMRILGEIPVRKFGKGEPGASATGGQPLDPDGNPDTSFLAKIPADVAFTFQTLDKHGMVLNMAQTWHQVRPGEIRNDCGGCHAHSQKPTPFDKTAAAKEDYPLFDLTRGAPLLASRKEDTSGKQWDVNKETGLKYDKSVKNVEFFRDIKPILNRSCTACHTKRWDKPAGNLVLDDDTPVNTARAGRQVGSYCRLAADQGAGFMKVLFGHKPPNGGIWGGGQASRYVHILQSRSSLLVWKLYGRRLDGLKDEDFTTEQAPGDTTTLQHKGRAVDPKTWKFKDDPKRQAPPFSLSFTGSVMPPPSAVAGTFVAPDGKKIKVQPLSDEDRRTIVRWIDLGCPIDLAYDPKQPDKRNFGWACDDQRPTLTLTYPKAGVNDLLTRILVGMHDYYSGLDRDSFTVTADFAIEGVEPGTNLAGRFRAKSQGVQELLLKTPITRLKRGVLTVSVKDRQGNLSRIERTFSVAPASAKR